MEKHLVVVKKGESVKCTNVFARSKTFILPLKL
jgi:hypothetical protein